MINTKLYELLDKAGIDFVHGLENKEITAVSANSAEIDSHSVYVAIKGSKHDGHYHVTEALQKGCAAVVAELDCAPEQITVANSRIAYARLCSALYAHPQNKMKMVAVTGTNGKTTVSDMLYTIFSEMGFKCALIGTVEVLYCDKRIRSHMTTPDPEHLYPLLSEIQSCGVEYVFMEASSHSLALDKLEPIEFECGIYTNLTPEHLDFHKTMKGYAQAKSKLFAKCKKGVFFLDDKYVLNEYNRTSCAKFGFSEKKRYADCYMDSLSYDDNGCVSFSFTSLNKQKLSVRLPLVGRFNARNALAAISAAELLGIDAKQSLRILEHYSGVAGRMQIVPNRLCLIVIDYAHTPDALKNAILALRESFANKRITVVFGCGGERDKGKRPIMGAIASEYSDRVIITSDNPRGEEPEDIIDDILRGIKKKEKVRIFKERRRAIEVAIFSASKDDAILICGKGHEDEQYGKNGKIHFSDIDTVCEILRKNKVFTSKEKGKK